MALTGSFLDRTITDFRLFADEPSVNAKYTDAVLIGKIEQAYAHIISEVHRNKIDPIVARFEVTYTASSSITYHILPWLMGSIFGIYTETTAGSKVFYDSLSRYNPYGRRIWVEGNTLCIQPNAISSGEVLVVEYIPTGTARLHTGTCTVDSTGKLVTFGATVTDGTLDTHVNAYAGSIFKLVSHTSGTYDFLQERTITAYANSTRIATLDTALSPNPESNATTSYEIAPAIHQGLDHVVALYMAYWLVSIEGSVVRARLLRNMYRDGIRDLRLNAYYSNLPSARKLRADNYDNPRYRG